MFTFMQQVSRRKLAWTGFVLLVAPFYSVIAAILKYGLGVGLFFDPLAAFFADPQRLRFLNFGNDAGPLLWRIAGRPGA